MNLSPDQEAWTDRARDADILDVAQRGPVNAKLRRAGREWIGACPACGGEDRFAVNPIKDGGVFLCRGAAGGDVIAMVRHVCQVGFVAACEVINGAPMPAADRQISAEEIAAAAERRDRERAERDRQREATQNAYRERERATAFNIWHAGLPLPGSPAEAYLRGRGLLELPPGLALRFAPEVAYFHGEADDERGRQAPRVVYRGPAMLAPIVDPLSGRFRAVHITWFDPVRPGRKATIRDPRSKNPNAALDAKKTRGSKNGNVIRLVNMSAQPRALYIGEGIETVLSVWYALHKSIVDAGVVDLIGAAFWASCDLGNLAGKAAASVAHPTEKDKGARPRRVGGSEPDLKSPAIAIPDSVDDVVLLGDGDSDRFTTACALARASKRFVLDSAFMTRAGRTVRAAWAPDGMDFNDLLREAA